MNVMAAVGMRSAPIVCSKSDVVSAISNTAVVLAFALLGCPNRTQSPGATKIEVDGDFVHVSGATFAPTLHGFERQDVTAFTSDQRDISVGYDLVSTSDQIAITVYVYPTNANSSDDALRSEFQRIKSEVLAAHPDAKIHWDEARKQEIDGRSVPHRRAAFGYRARFNHRRQSVSSYAVLFRAGDWWLKFRMTHPIGKSESAQPKMLAVIKTFTESFFRAVLPSTALPKPQQ